MCTDTNVSIVICVYNDWKALEYCLSSLSEQSAHPLYEVIVVDDGSHDEAPSTIRNGFNTFPLEIVRQPHAGISAVRNKGFQISRNPVVLFVDADCRLDPNCLAELDKAVALSPESHYFQLHLTGDTSTAVGKTEELRLITLQDHLLQADGRIRYLNTAGFAVRRKNADVDKELFDPAALRAEDTLLLADLILCRSLPVFIPGAVVQHARTLSVAECLRKDVRSAYLEARTYELIASRGVQIRVGHRDRLRMLRSMWQTSARRPIGRIAFFLLAARQTLRLIVALGYRWFGGSLRHFSSRREQNHRQ